LLAQDQGAALQAALERRAEEIVLGDEPLSPPQEARMADALVELTCSGGEGEPAPPTLVVHADAAVLTGEHRRKGPWLSETEGWTRLSSEGVRRLACDARIEWVLEHAGRTVGSGVGAGPFRGPCSGSSSTGTGDAGSLGAGESGGLRPITSPTGRGEVQRTWTTWCCCATHITA
jgi:uncharacterized protein DUF222